MPRSLRLHVFLLVGLGLACACKASAPPAEPSGNAPAAAAGAPRDHRPALEAAARALVDAGRARSVAVATVHDGRTWSAAYGEASAGTPATADGTVYEIGSVTKVFTALLLADAIEREEIAPDATIGDVAKGLALSPEVADTKLVALSNHTSGLPRMPANFAPANRADPYADYEVDRLWAALSEVELGPKQYAYSNFGVAVLGQLLARRAGTTYEALLRARVLEPLGLDVRLRPGEHDAQPHDDAGRPQPSWRFDAFAPAGAVRASALDMLPFVRAHLSPPSLDGPLSAALARVQRRTTGIPAGEGGVGLGWHIDGGGRRWHNGQTLGSHAFVGLSADGEGVVVLANSGTPDVDRVGRAMLDILGGEQVELTFAPVVEVPPEQLRRYVGEYTLQPGFTLTMSVDEGRLTVQATGQPAFALTPLGDHTFELSAVGAQARFLLPESGPATAVIWNQAGRSAQAPRVAD